MRTAAPPNVTGRNLTAWSGPADEGGGIGTRYSEGLRETSCSEPDPGVTGRQVRAHKSCPFPFFESEQYRGDWAVWRINSGGGVEPHVGFLSSKQTQGNGRQKRHVWTFHCCVRVSGRKGIAPAALGSTGCFVKVAAVCGLGEVYRATFPRRSLSAGKVRKVGLARGPSCSLTDTWGTNRKRGSRPPRSRWPIRCGESPPATMTSLTCDAHRL